MANKYGDDVLFVLVVGQSPWQSPATVSDAATYKQSHGYTGSNWIAVADPNWMKTDGAIVDKTGTLPNMSVLDGQMKLVHTSTGSSWISDADNAINQAVLAAP